MTLNNLGALLRNMGRIEEAKQRYEKALEMREKLLQTDPENVGYQSRVGGTFNNLGNLLWNMGRIEGAKQRCEKALEIYEKLLQTDPENVGYQSYVGGTLNNLGTLLSAMGRIEEAKQRYEKALEMREKLLQTDPENVGYQSDVATTLNNLGILLSDMGRIEEAKQRYEKALEMREKLLQTDPENVGYQSDVAMTLNNLGLLLSYMGRIEEAKQRYEKALEIYTEPMQYLTISKKSNSIIRLIRLSTEQAKTETNDHLKIKYLEQAYKLCKKSQAFLSKYELKYEKKLVMGAGLSAYLDYVIINVKGERKAEKRADGYEKAIQTIESLGKIEKDEEVENIVSSTICYLEGRKLVNEALGSEQPDLELIKQAANLFKEAKETYKKANVCYCIYIGLLKILENVEIFEDKNSLKAKETIDQIIEVLPEDIDQNIRTSFEEITKIFDEKDIKGRKKHLEEFDAKIRAIESKALENIFGHVHKKLKDYVEEPFSPNVFYENWELRVIFDDPEKVKGKLTIKIGSKTLLNRALTAEEVKSNLLEINYLDKKYFPQGEDEIIFSIPEQKTVTRPISYFENIISEENKTRILLHDCSENLDIESRLQIAAIQLKYNVYVEDYVVKLVADEAYHRKIEAILKAMNGKADIVVFPEFSIPFDYLDEIKQYSEDTGIIVVAGSHYITKGNLEKYGQIFNREFREKDLRKNISPVVTPCSKEEDGVVIPSSKIVHNEKLVGAREERELFFNEGMEAGEINHIFKLRDDLHIGIMICYEYLNSNLRNRLIPVCDVILVPQTNPSPERFYQTAKNDINNPSCSGNKAYIMANGIFTVGTDKKVLGGSIGIVSTLDKYSYQKQDEGIIKPVDKVMEQFILLTSINMGFNPARDTQSGQVPIKTKLIHIFEEREIISDLKVNDEVSAKLLETIGKCDGIDEIKRILREKGERFIEILDTIEKCDSQVALEELIKNADNKAIIKAFSPLMHKQIEALENIKAKEIKRKCCRILIPAK
jgi:Tfp pilus assembly protein PilF/predicted amidohydrolase